MYDIEYQFILNNIDGKWLINNIKCDLDDFKLYEEKMNKKFQSNKAVSRKELVDENFKQINESMKKFDMDYKEKQLSIGKSALGLENSSINNNTAMAAASYPYTASNGVKYARKYGGPGANNPSFYTASRTDCTNFVSQCVWASYGGYVDGNVTATNNNILNKVRMYPSSSYTTGWYAGSGGGARNWESVMYFYSFVTSSPAKGPKGKDYNNGSKASNIMSTTFRLGDVLQTRNGSSGDYGHSVYITSVKSNPTSFHDISITQHGSNVVDRDLYNLCTVHGGYDNCYMRGIHFSSATFDK